MLEYPPSEQDLKLYLIAAKEDQEPYKVRTFLDSHPDSWQQKARNAPLSVLAVSVARELHHKLKAAGYDLLPPADFIAGHRDQTVLEAHVHDEHMSAAPSVDGHHDMKIPLACEMVADGAMGVIKTGQTTGTMRFHERGTERRAWLRDMGIQYQQIRYEGIVVGVRREWDPRRRISHSIADMIVSF
jgi:hypothetical protein